MKNKTKDRWMPPILIGWAALGASVFILLAVSLASWMQTRDMRCSTEFSYTLAPLLATCGERTIEIQMLGWLLTIFAVGGHFVAGVLAVVTVVNTMVRSSGALQSAETMSYVIAVAGVALCMFVARTTIPDEIGVNGWDLIAASTATIVLIAAATLLRPLCKLIFRRVDSKA